MSECDLYCSVTAPRNAEFYGDNFRHQHVSINRPRFETYIVRVREPGARRYRIVCRTDSQDHAFRQLGETMSDSRWKRGDIFAVEGPESWYEPTRLVEMVR